MCRKLKLTADNKRRPKSLLHASHGRRTLTWRTISRGGRALTDDARFRDTCSTSVLSLSGERQDTGNTLQQPVSIRGQELFLSDRVTGSIMLRKDWWRRSAIETPRKKSEGGVVPSMNLYAEEQNRTPTGGKCGEDRRLRTRGRSSIAEMLPRFSASFSFPFLPFLTTL